MKKVNQQETPSLMQGGDSTLYSQEQTLQTTEEAKRRRSSLRRLSGIQGISEDEAYKIAQMSPSERAERVKYLKQLVS